MLFYLQVGFGIAVVLAWAWMLGRPLLMNVLNASQRDPIGHFNRQIDALGDAPRQSASHIARGSRGPVAVGKRRSTRKGRLQFFLALCMSVAASAMLALIWGGLFFQTFVLMALGLAGFVAVAARGGALELERQQKVAYLQPVPSYSEASSRAVRVVGERG